MFNVTEAILFASVPDAAFTSETLTTPAATAPVAVVAATKAVVTSPAAFLTSAVSAAVTATATASDCVTETVVVAADPVIVILPALELPAVVEFPIRSLTVMLVPPVTVTVPEAPVAVDPDKVAVTAPVGRVAVVAPPIVTLPVVRPDSVTDTLTPPV